MIGERLGTLNKKGGQVRGQRAESLALIVFPGTAYLGFPCPTLMRDVTRATALIIGELNWRHDRLSERANIADLRDILAAGKDNSGENRFG